MDLETSYPDRHVSWVSSVTLGHGFSNCGMRTPTGVIYWYTALRKNLNTRQDKNEKKKSEILATYIC
jgi:hypothetical protein